MPRTARIDIPGILQHVMVRGIEKCDIFLDDLDRNFFLKRLSFLLEKTETDCLAWALMPNHFHLLLRPRTGKLSTVMRRLLTSYAIYFNKQHNRVGHLFQNRYKSIICEEESYLLELIRYIHLNPLRAGMVKNMEDLARYPWTGHAVLMGRRAMPGQHIDEIFIRFGEQPYVARHRYRDFIAEGLNATNAEADDPVEGRESADWDAFCTSLKSLKIHTDSDFSADERILGSASFAQSILEHDDDNEEEDTVEKPAASRISVSELLTTVAEHFNIPEESFTLKTRAPEITIARGIFCYLSVRKHGFTAAEIARTLRLTRSGVCMAVRRGEKILAESPGMRKIFRVS